MHPALRIGATGIVAGIVSAPALADVTPVISSIECSARTHLTVVDLNDEEITTDDQGATNNALGLITASATLNTPDGFFETHTDGVASFTDSSSGSFSAGCGYSGSQAAKEPMAQSFQSTMKSTFQYDFFTTDTGTIRFTGNLFNGGISIIHYTGAVWFNKETTPGGGIVGGGTQTSIQDHEHDGEAFDFTLPLDSPTGNYRITLFISHSGNGGLDQPLTNGTFTANFVIEGDGCDGDFNGDDVLDVFDILDFLDAFNAGDPTADFTNDGQYDIFDLLAFLDAFNAGCP